MTVYTMRKILADSVPVTMLLVAIGIAAGRLLATSEDTLLTLPVLLALVPAINSGSGMVGAVLGARVATGLHTGSLLSSGARQFRRDLLATVIIGTAVFFALALVAVAGAQVTESPAVTLLADLALVILGTGVLLIVGMIITVIVLGSLSFRFGWDPDSILVPAVTTTGDLMGITSFIFMVRWVGL